MKVTVRNAHEFVDMAAEITNNWGWDKPVEVTIKPITKKHNPDQMALCRLWIRQLTDHFNLHRPESSEFEYDEDWVANRMKHKFGERECIIDPVTGEETRRLKSLGKYKRGEMFFFMTALQDYAFEHCGLVLESCGEYEQIKREQAGMETDRQVGYREQAVQNQ
jgi:hypothetical protein